MEWTWWTHFQEECSAKTNIQADSFVEMLILIFNV